MSTSTEDLRKEYVDTNNNEITYLEWLEQKLTKEPEVTDGFKECPDCGKLKLVGTICKNPATGLCDLPIGMVKEPVKSADVDLDQSIETILFSAYETGKSNNVYFKEWFKRNNALYRIKDLFANQSHPVKSEVREEYFKPSKSDLIKQIMCRIKDEHRKHYQSLPNEWAEICARKIVATYNTISNEPIHPELSDSDIERIFNDNAKHYFHDEDEFRISCMTIEDFKEYIKKGLTINQKDECIRFAEWCIRKGYDRWGHDNKWRLHDDDETPLDDNQLFDLYLSKSNN